MGRRSAKQQLLEGLKFDQARTIPPPSEQETVDIAPPTVAAPPNADTLAELALDEHLGPEAPSSTRDLKGVPPTIPVGGGEIRHRTAIIPRRRIAVDDSGEVQVWGLEPYTTVVDLPLFIEGKPTDDLPGAATLTDEEPPLHETSEGEVLDLEMKRVTEDVPRAADASADAAKEPLVSEDGWIKLAIDKR